MTKKSIFIVIFLFVIFALGAWQCFDSANKVQTPIVSISAPAVVVNTTPVAEVSKHSECLMSDEVADYNPKNWGNMSTTTVAVTVTDQKKNLTIAKFFMPDIRPSYHPIEVHRCGVYAVREFGFDSAHSIFYPSFNWTIWRYDYTGQGKRLLVLAEKLHNEDDKHIPVYFSTDFRIDPTEKYLTLTTGYLGTSTYAIVIKNLKTLKDVFTLSVTEIEKQNPDIVGNIGFIETLPNAWTPDGRYFWADLGDGAVELGFIRIDSTDWSYKLLPAPADVLGGDALNLETGDITVHPGHIWSGDAEEAKILADTRRAKGIGTDLYIENLFTHKRTLIATTAEPNAYFHPRWISSTTLEYFIPKPDGSMGERREFVLTK